jgi:hypothetical protein
MPTHPLSVNYIGLKYQAKNDDIKNIIQLTQKLLNDMQISECLKEKQIIDAQKAQIINFVKAQPLKCSQFDKLAKEFASMIDGDPVIENALMSLWIETKKILCDNNGNIDPVQLEKLLNSLHNGFCTQNLSKSGSDMYFGASIHSDNYLESFIKQLQSSIYELQKKGCKMFKDDMDNFRKEYIDELTKNPVSCKANNELIMKDIDQLVQEISYPGFDSQSHKNTVNEINNFYSKNICNTDGNVDPKMLNTFMDNMYGSFCS